MVRGCEVRFLSRAFVCACEWRHRVTCRVFTEFAVLPDRIQVTKILIRGVGWSRVDGIVFTNKRNSGSCPPHGEHVYELGEKRSKRSQAFWAPRRGVGGAPRRPAPRRGHEPGRGRVGPGPGLSPTPCPGPTAPPGPTARVCEARGPVGGRVRGSTESRKPSGTC